VCIVKKIYLFEILLDFAASYKHLKLVLICNGSVLVLRGVVVNIGADCSWITTNFRCLYAIANPTAVFQTDRPLTTCTLFDWVLLHLTYTSKYCCRFHCDMNV